MTIAILAEKPSVARDIAQVVGARARAEGAMQGNGYVVTWAVGHLVAVAQPHQMKPDWRRWSFQQLPMIPSHWPLEVYPRTQDQYEVVARILNRDDVDEIVCATDAGREGELIFRYIYEKTGSRKPIRRLWISSLTPDAIRAGLANLGDGRAYEPLADAARGRSRADWLVGLNLSRAYSLAYDDQLSVGRVQTPTLAMLVERELAIRAFVPESYLEVLATFRPRGSGENEGSTYIGVYFDDSEGANRTGGDGAADGAEASVPSKRDARAQAGPSGIDDRVASAQAPQRDEQVSAAEQKRNAQRLPTDGERAKAIATRALTGHAEVASIETRQQKLPPPRLYDLTELQRHANRLFGFSAQRTLELAQQLYESKKLLSYPRTDSRHLSADVADTLPGVVRAIADRYPGLLAEGTGDRPLGRRFVDDARVTDHHAIIPTQTAARGASLTRDQERIYDLVCRRLLSAWHADHLYSTTQVVTTITQSAGEEDREGVVDHYRSSGTRVDRDGWKVLDLRYAPSGSETPNRAPGSERRDAATDASAAQVGTGGAAATPQTANAGRSPATPGSPFGQELPRGLDTGTVADVLDAQAVARQTRPPPHFTEATLLTAMETAGRELEEKELSDAMRKTGLGTPATRASIIETLLAREYAQRRKKSLVATDKGIRLIDVVHPEVKSPIMTGQWEARLQRIQDGSESLASFIQGIEAFVREAVARVEHDGARLPTPSERHGSAYAAGAIGTGDGAAAPTRIAGGDAATPGGVSSTQPKAATATRLPAAAAGSALAPPPSAAKHGPEAAALAPPLHARAPTPPEKLHELLAAAFGFEQFRPYQEAVCRAVTQGDDVLLVMPTGAGKSLCYQLPGLARAATTLVVSPLIALMEDQVIALQARGLRAERIHSGRGRLQSRAVCNQYLAGELDFLFIAPERFSVPGFPELLARRKPGLVAVDEAHCISQWGHDFRPDYRMLKERLPALRPAPVIGLTATATPTVQRDIVEQLGVPDARRFIHGFRRDNIAIEVVGLTPASRDEATAELLADASRRPAIVYAPTRKKADALAAHLARQLSCAAYHAGMTTEKREQVQLRFLSGELEIIVATIAFGMGIDKPDVRSVVHTALPASLEGYYQEIGRAGRDGLPSRAVLYHSYADRRTHEWFTERDYPAAEVLRRVQRELGGDPQPSEAVRQRCRIDEETFEKALEKLWIHGGAVVTAGDRVSRGHDRWEAPYLAQRRNREDQLARMARFSERRSCRMLHLVGHFGDQEDDGSACGQCDVCDPDGCVALTLRPPSAPERRQLLELVEALRRRGSQGVGRLHQETFGERLARPGFERLLAALTRAGLASEADDSFERDGEEIRYRRVSLTSAGRRANEAALASVKLEPAAAKAPARAAAGARKRARRKTAAEKATGGTRSAGKRKKAAQRSSTASKRGAATGRSPREAVASDGRAPTAPSPSEASPHLVADLRDWRLAEAERRNSPAFRVLSNTALLAIAAARPRSEDQLLDVAGVGPALTRKYGRQILSIVERHCGG